MKVNGINIETYGAKQLTARLKQANMKKNCEWNTRQKMPIVLETEIGFSSLKLTLYFVGVSRSDVQKKISEFIMQFDDETEISIDKYKGIFVGYLQNSEQEDTLEQKKKKLTIELNGYMRDEEIKIQIKGLEKKQISRIGTRDAPCVIEIKANATISNFIIKGFQDDIKIISIPIGKTMIIDGIRGTMKIDNVNASDKVDLWEFPYIPKKTIVQGTHKDVDIKIRYYPMWR